MQRKDALKQIRASFSFALYAVYTTHRGLFLFWGKAVRKTYLFCSIRLLAASETKRKALKA